MIDLRLNPGAERRLDVVDSYVARLVRDWDGGGRTLSVAWDNDNGAAGEVMGRLMARIPGRHVLLNGAVDGGRAAQGTRGAACDIGGVRVSTADGWWLLRASNTQAVLVARAEARDETGLERLKDALAAELAYAGVTAPDFMSARH